MTADESPSFDNRLAPDRTARFLSNGRYHLLLTPTGTGYSQWGALRLNAWRADRTADADGFFVYLRDRDSGESWRVGEPADGVVLDARRYQARLAITGTWRGIEANLDVFVAPDDDLEVRRLTVRNDSERRRTLDIRSLIEVVLHSAAAHAAHPVFSRLFLQTEALPDERLLMVRRRSRSPEENFPMLFHTAVGGKDWRFETDRARLVGRRLPGERPLALAEESSGPGHDGNVLDPALSHAVTLVLEPGAAASVVFALGVAPDGDTARRLAQRVADPVAVHSWQAAAVDQAINRLGTLGSGVAPIEYYEAVAADILFGRPSLALDPRVAGVAARTHRADLAAMELAPGRALALLDAAGAGLEEEFGLMARYWTALDLPIESCFVAASTAVTAIDGVRRLEPTPDQRRALRREARLFIDAAMPVPGGTGTTAPAMAPAIMPQPAVSTSVAAAPTARPVESLLFDNGCGGFAADGREYVVRLPWETGRGFRRPPLPWTNVIANEMFGLVVSEIGAGTTWSANSREYRLTPWSNDPQLDPPGESFYIRDEATGRFWSPLPGPAPLPVDHEMRHGFGYSRASLTGEGLEQTTDIFVARHDPIRFTRVRLVNRSGAARHLSLYAAYRLVLGHTPDETARFLTTDIDPTTGALLARNRHGGDFAGRVAFAVAVTEAPVRSRSATMDRAIFLGVHGTEDAPAAVRAGGELDGAAGSGLDPMFAQRVRLDVPAGSTVEVTFLLGDAASEDEARDLIAGYATPAAVTDAWDTVRRFWDDELAAVRITTPSPALDLMVNGWLPYQTLACRIWGRSAFYQSGGAFGFRDQLQDSASLLFLKPELTRAQLLQHAAHQFIEGDVLHWWHPPASVGIRTRFADDLLWLPGLLAEYVAATGDDTVLDEVVPFRTARLLDPDEDEAFLRSEVSSHSGSVYDHAARAIDRSLRVGEHGLPFFGTGDWNDGMNRVGRLGRGESVWMGFFLYHVLGNFLPLCMARGDTDRADRYREHRESLRVALNDGGWDGGWYRRGWYDSGAPLGSIESDECRIDALAQAWAVLSGAAPPDRAGAAMDRVAEHLISEPEQLIRLLTPPFDRTPEDPGYIKGYVPGVRENGGQYTHAALWVVRAMAELGRNNTAADLLELLNPVRHAATPEQVARYQVEPYVVAADVYGVAPHVGRGGWTWYTGSSGWMYRVALESILGVTWVNGDTLRLKPCIPDDWPGFTLRWRRPGGTTVWEITARNSDGDGRGVRTAHVDGAVATVVDGVAHIDLVEDGMTHRIELETGTVRVVLAAV